MLTAAYAENGISFVELIDLLNMPRLRMKRSSTRLTYPIDCKTCCMNNVVIVHFCMLKLLEAFKHKLFTGCGLKRQLTKQYTVVHSEYCP